MIRSGLRPSKTTRRPSPSAPTQPVVVHLDVVEEDEELLVGQGDLDGDRRRGEPLRASVSTTRRLSRPRPWSSAVAGAHDDEDRLGLVDEGDERLLSAHAPRRRRRAPAVVEMRWLLEPASGSVIAKAIFSPAARPGQPPRALRVGPVAGEELAADRRRDERRQQRAARRGGLLADDRRARRCPRRRRRRRSGRCTAEEAVVARARPTARRPSRRRAPWPAKYAWPKSPATSATARRSSACSSLSEKSTPSPASNVNGR